MPESARRCTVILGLSTATFTFLHVLISLVAIASGLAVVFGFLTGKRLDRWTGLFLITTALTSLTGFAFPNKHITPGIVVGILSLIVLTVAVLARYRSQLRGAARPAYIVTAALALYFNVFVLVVQSFEKVPALNALAPTQKEAPFKVAQTLVLLLFVVATVAALKRFRPDAALAGTSTNASSGQRRAA
jgi:hypothetical protein